MEKENITINDVQEIISILSENERQLLRDTIVYGGWGDSTWEFLDKDGNIEEVAMYGYCTNDAKLAGHFSGKQCSGLFNSIYKKLCPEKYNQIGKCISHCNDWWGDGSGDMLFIRIEYVHAFEQWAKEFIPSFEPWITK